MKRGRPHQIDIKFLEKVIVQFKESVFCEINKKVILKSDNIWREISDAVFEATGAAIGNPKMI